MPLVMYSQPWSPTPSTTAVAPELRTAKRSPATPLEERFAAGRAVKGDVADEDIFFRSEAGSARRIHHESAPGEALSNVVVGFALERKRDSLGKKGPQALTGRARKVNAATVVVGQSGRAVTTCDFTAEHASTER